MESQTVTAVAPGPKPFSVPTLPVELSQEADIRAIANAAEAAGDQTGDSVVTVPQKGVPTQTPSTSQATLPNPNALSKPPVVTQAAAPETPQPQAQIAPPGTPEKFLKPDGTVDEEKLLASSKQLDAAIEQKQLSVEEMVAEYKAKEAQFRGLPNPNNPDSIARLAQAQQQVQQQMPAAQIQQPQVVPNQQALQQQILQDLNRDPIGTIVDIVKSVTSTENKPLHDFVTTLKEQQKDQGMKNNLMALVKEDPRVANPAVYQAVLAEIQADPGYLQLRNPYKAAWNEVKARLRLGDAPIPAQPSKTASPILGGGTPPPVPSTSGGYSPQTIGAAIGMAKPGDEMARLEAELRNLSIQSGF